MLPMDWYGVAKALHVISVIAWMAGMFYLPRLFVYHAEAGAGSPQSDTFKVMERRLLRAIMNPAMIATYVFGIAMLALTPGWLSDGWLHAKLALVVAMTVVHHVYAYWRKQFDRDGNRHTARFYRIWNEVPTLLLVGIVFLVILKPF